MFSEKAKKHADACRFCYMCRHLCPIELVTGKENNTPRAKALNGKEFLRDTTLIFGSENNGITPELLEKANDVRFIESFGSTRSVNVGVAAGIAMYEYTRQIVL